MLRWPCHPDQTLGKASQEVSMLHDFAYSSAPQPLDRALPLAFYLALLAREPLLANLWAARPLP